MMKKSQAKTAVWGLILAIGVFAIAVNIYQHHYSSASFILIMLLVVITNRKKLLDRWFSPTSVQ